jgi:hypothetical protein
MKSTIYYNKPNDKTPYKLNAKWLVNAIDYALACSQVKKKKGAERVLFVVDKDEKNTEAS